MDSRRFQRRADASRVRWERRDLRRQGQGRFGLVSNLRTGGKAGRKSPAKHRPWSTLEQNSGWL